MAHVCLCDNCPDVPDEYSKCCLTEAKNKKVCNDESVPCITKVGKMAKVWDKVTNRNTFFIMDFQTNYQEVLEIALNAYDETLGLGYSSPPNNE